MAARKNFVFKIWRKCVYNKTKKKCKIVIPVRFTELIDHGFKRKDLKYLLFKTTWNNGKMMVEFKKQSIFKRLFRRRK